MGEPQGASIVKWTTLDSCKGLSKSDSKPYTNYNNWEFFYSKNVDITNPSNLCLPNNFKI